MKGPAAAVAVSINGNECKAAGTPSTAASNTATLGGAAASTIRKSTAVGTPDRTPPTWITSAYDLDHNP